MRERFEIIRSVCASRTCLDIGIIGNLDQHLAAKEKWVFHHVCEVGHQAFGLDLDAKGLAEMRRHGYRNLVCADAENFSLHIAFDVIVGGEIIEHLNNPGLFIARCRHHLKPDGVLLLTTPNTFSVNNLVKGLLFGRVALFHEHVNAYTPALLTELLRREGLEVFDIHYTTERNPGLKNALFRFLSRIRGPWSEGILIIAKARRAGGR